MKNHLSTRQTQILSYIRDYISRKGYPPSVRDIQRQCDISSTSVVDYNLRRMTEKGYIERDYGISRSIRVLGPGQEFRTVLLEGYIERERYPYDAAPRGITLDVPAFIVDGNGTVRAWRVRAGCMPDALAAQGDLLLVQEDVEPQDGDTIVAWVKSRGETVIRRQYLKGATVRLESLNPSYKDMTVLVSDIVVTGKVVGCYGFAEVMQMLLQWITVSSARLCNRLRVSARVTGQTNDYSCKQFQWSYREHISLQPISPVMLTFRRR